MMTLLKAKATRKGFENYTDLYLAWEYKGKKYFVRVRPVFGCDNDKLLASAILVPEGEQLEKYLQQLPTLLPPALSAFYLSAITVVKVITFVNSETALRKGDVYLQLTIVICRSLYSSIEQGEGIGAFFLISPTY